MITKGLRKKIRLLINLIYLIIVKIRYRFRKYFFNIEYANKLFLGIDRSAVIPLIRFCGGKVGKNCSIESPIYFHLAVKDLSNLNIGDNTCISKGCFFDLAEKINIGSNCTLGMEVMITTHTHFGKINFKNLYSNNSAPVTIKSNSYIGARTIILNGIVIEGISLIAADSLINKNIPEKSLIAGVPGKVIRKLEMD